MKVAHRLYFTALPSVFGLLAVAALAYWGQFARSVPEFILVVAAVAAMGTMALSWINVRFIAERVERLTHLPPVAQSASQSGDELETIADVVAELDNAVRSEQAIRSHDQAALKLRRTEYARVLADVASGAIQGVKEIRLPLHILLENHFGELNENQEEMLAAARAAAEEIDRNLEALRELAHLDLNKLTLRSDRFFPADIVQALLPSMKAITESHGVALQADIATLIPPIVGDPIRLQEALLVLLSQHAAALPGKTEMRLSLATLEGRAVITLEPEAVVHDGVQQLVARRILSLAGANIEPTGQGVRIILPN